MTPHEDIGILIAVLTAAHTSLRTFSDAVPDEEKCWTTYDADVLEMIEKTLEKYGNG